MSELAERRDKILKQIDEKETTLMEVANPNHVQPASIEIDSQLGRLAHNLSVLAKVKLIAGTEYVWLDRLYKKRKMELSIELDDEKLKSLALVRSTKWDYIRAALYEESGVRDEMKAKVQYFSDMWETYREWVNIYKKIRDIPDYH